MPEWYEYGGCLAVCVYFLLLRCRLKGPKGREEICKREKKIFSILAGVFYINILKENGYRIKH